MRILKILLLALSLNCFSVLAQDSDSISINQNVTYQIFSGTEYKELYKVNIEFKEQSFSGLMIIRKSADSVVRLAFVTEVGLKIFEFVFYPRKKDNFEVVSIIEPLNKKVIIKTLKRDFESILMPFVYYKSPKVQVRGESLEVTYAADGQRIYYLNAQSDIFRMVRKKCFFKKEEVLITPQKNPYPIKVDIKHYGIKLNIEMKLTYKN